MLIGASLSEPHIDELNVRNLYIIESVDSISRDGPDYNDGTYVYVRQQYFSLHRRLYCNIFHPCAAIHVYFVQEARDIFRKPHEETSPLSQQNRTRCLKAEVADSDCDLAYASALPGRHMNA